MKLIIALEFGSTGALEMLVFHRLLDGKGTKPLRLVSCPTAIPAQVAFCAIAGRFTVNCSKIKASAPIKYFIAKTPAGFIIVRATFARFGGGQDLSSCRRPHYTCC